MTGLSLEAIDRAHRIARGIALQAGESLTFSASTPRQEVRFAWVHDGRERGLCFHFSCFQDEHGEWNVAETIAAYVAEVRAS